MGDPFVLGRMYCGAAQLTFLARRRPQGVPKAHKETNLAKVQPGCFRGLLRFRDGLPLVIWTIFVSDCHGLGPLMVNSHEARRS